MKIAVINLSGNVGKTTVSAHLLKPRMGDAPIFSIESVNADASADGLEVEKMRGKKFGELQEKLMTLDSAIIDVGSSNVEDFLKFMQQYAGSHIEFDLFVIPVVKDKKQQGDTVKTIRALGALGVPPERIVTVFNKVQVDETVATDFEAFVGLEKLEHSFTLRHEAVIYENEVFDLLKTVGKSLGEVTTDKTDYRAKLRTLTTDTEKENCVRMVAIQRLAVTANKNLDAVYSAIIQ